MRAIHFEYTTGCNSKCAMCDYWKKEFPIVLQNDIVRSAVSSLIPLGIKKAYFTGGECLMYADSLFSICYELKEKYPNLELGLITNGILLEKYYEQIGELFSKVIVSLDTINPVKYQAIRGVNALPIVQQGIHLLRKEFPSTRVNIRMLVLDETVDDITTVIDYAIKEELYHLSFLPESLESEAFGRTTFSEPVAHHSQKCLPKLRDAIIAVSSSYTSYYGRLLPRGCGDLEYVYSVYSGTSKCCVVCNKASDSCVISAAGYVNPCFFISGNQRLDKGKDLAAILTSDDYIKLVSQISSHQHPNCLNCACPKEIS